MAVSLTAAPVPSRRIPPYSARQVKSAGLSLIYGDLDGSAAFPEDQTAGHERPGYEVPAGLALLVVVDDRPAHLPAVQYVQKRLPLFRGLAHRDSNDYPYMRPWTRAA